MSESPEIGTGSWEGKRCIFSMRSEGGKRRGLILESRTLLLSIEICTALRQGGFLIHLYPPSNT